MMQMRIVQELRHELRVEGVATSTIFPMVEVWLQGTSKHWYALEAVASRKHMSRYRSIVDFVFVELFPKWRPACFRFYEDRGPLLRHLIMESQREVYEREMLLFLQVAFESVRQGYHWNWTQTMREAQRLAA